MGRMLSAEMAGGEVGEELRDREQSPDYSVQVRFTSIWFMVETVGVENAMINLRNTLKERRCQEMKQRGDFRMSPSCPALQIRNEMIGEGGW